MQLLPPSPAPQDVTVSAVDFGNTLTPPLGGAQQRINRPGNRWMLSVTMPPMPTDEIGRIFISRLVRAKSEGLRMKFPLNGVNVGNPGSPVIDGAGQAGRLINLRGFAPNYTVKEGFFFSIETNGTHYLYHVNDGITLDASGAGSIIINPMLREPPNDGDPCNFAEPMIEGLVEGQDWEWNYSLAHNSEMSFDLKERK